MTDDLFPEAPEYPFEDFKADYEAISPAVHTDGSPQAYLFTMQLMRNRYEATLTEQQIKHRVAVYCFASRYLDTRVDDFDMEDFAVTASKEALISFHLMRAVHQFYNVQNPFHVESPSPQEVMALARTFKAKPLDF